MPLNFLPTLIFSLVFFWAFLTKHRAVLNWVLPWEHFNAKSKLAAKWFFCAKGIFFKAKFCQKHVNKYGLSKLVFFYYLWQKVIFTICRQTEVFVCICSHGATILYLSTLCCLSIVLYRVHQFVTFKNGFVHVRTWAKPKNSSTKKTFETWKTI